MLSIIKHIFLLSILGLFLNNFRIDFTLFKVIHLILSLVILEYYAYILHKKLFAYQKRKKDLKELIKNEERMVESFLDDDFRYLDSSEISEEIEKIERHIFHPKISKEYGDRISKHLIIAKRAFEKLRHTEEINELETRKRNVAEELETLESDLLHKTQTDEERIEEIKEGLELEENPVFYKSDLSDEEIEILKNEGYEQSNEYSVVSNKVETFLIGKVMNHSKTHTFLVWDIMELLYDLDMEKITEHKTIDADITFKYKNKIYAIEVETGTLLKKKEQVKTKIDYLNKKYKDRWLIVVSNRDYLKKYKKLGFSTQRKQVRKTLEKWLKLDI